MSEPIHDRKQGSGDIVVSNGYYAIDPNGDMILVPPLQKLKDGWRLAAQSDIDARKPKSAAVAKYAPAAPVPAPPKGDPIV